MVLFNQKPLQSSISSLRNLFHKVCFPENVIIQSCPVYQNNTILSYFYFSELMEKLRIFFHFSRIFAPVQTDMNLSGMTIKSIQKNIDSKKETDK